MPVLPTSCSNWLICFITFFYFCRWDVTLMLPFINYFFQQLNNFLFPFQVIFCRSCIIPFCFHISFIVNILTDIPDCIQPFLEYIIMTWNEFMLFPFSKSVDSAALRVLPVTPDGRYWGLHI